MLCKATTKKKNIKGLNIYIFLFDINFKKIASFSKVISFLYMGTKSNFEEREKKFNNSTEDETLPRKNLKL